MPPSLRRELPLIVAAVAAGIALPFEHTLADAGRGVAGIAAAVLVAVILGASIRIAHHAEALAEHVGEPYGTMILTLSAVLLEVVILAIMLGHTTSPTLVRDTIYSAVMLDINALLGLSALLGGLRHGEQPYNVDSGNTYVVMILTAIGVSMVLPAFVPVEHWPAYFVFTIITMVLMYGLFLRLQVGRHSYFFSYAYAQHVKTSHGGAPAQVQAQAQAQAQAPATPDRDAPAPSVLLLVATIAIGLLLVGLLAEVMAATLDAALAGSAVPPIVAPLLVATISASPEILTALRAALANRMQPVVNIALGASLSTVILTVPVLEALALFTGHPLHMALTGAQGVMVLLTLLVAMINIHDGETNAIEGMTHFVLFMAFLMLSALGL